MLATVHRTRVGSLAKLPTGRRYVTPLLLLSEKLYLLFPYKREIVTIKNMCFLKQGILLK